LSFATIVDRASKAAQAGKGIVFTRPSILFQPHQKQTQINEADLFLVELPGTAPGSEPLITRAFIAIVPKNVFYIGD